MLSEEQVKAELEAAWDNDWREKCRRRGSSLSGGSGLLLQEICTVRKISYGNYVAIGNKELKQNILTWAGELDSVDLKTRQKFFNVIFPKIGIYVERTWRRLINKPTRDGYNSIFYRIPDNPQSSLWDRVRWLFSLVEGIGGYDRDICWLAKWREGLAYFAYDTLLAEFFAAVLDGSDNEADAVFQILRDSIEGIGSVPGNPLGAYEAFMSCSRADAWEFMEQLFLAAQREEGLRQSIIESAITGHPGFLKRILKIVGENNLSRFSSVVYAFNHWLGYNWDSASTKVTDDLISHVEGLLLDEKMQKRALSSDNAEGVYLALRAISLVDAEKAVHEASIILQSKNTDKRFAAISLVARLGITSAKKLLVEALDDSDLRVVVVAVGSFASDWDAYYKADDVFERLENIAPKFPIKKTQLEPLVWPWVEINADVKVLCRAFLRTIGKRDPQRLIKYRHLMDPYTREQLAVALGSLKKFDQPARDTILELLGDTSGGVRAVAIKVLKKIDYEGDEVEKIESLLSRKAGDLRRGVLQLLFKQKDKQVLGSVDRLLGSGKSLQRLAGLELLRLMYEGDRCVGQCRQKAETYAKKRKKISELEKCQLDVVLDSEKEVLTFENVLGLIDPQDRTVPVKPRKVEKPVIITDAVRNLVRSLDDLIDEYRETEITVNTHWGEETVLLGQADWKFPRACGCEDDKVEKPPLWEVWDKWWCDRPESCRDEDGLELIRADLVVSRNFERYCLVKRGHTNVLLDRELNGKEYGASIKYKSLISFILDWQLKFREIPGAVEFYLDFFENYLFEVPEEQLNKTLTASESDRKKEVVSNGECIDYYHSNKRKDWRENILLNGWTDEVRSYRGLRPAAWQAEHHKRFYGLLRWIDEPFSGTRRFRPRLEDLVFAYRVGGATEADLYDQVLGSRADEENAWYYGIWSELSEGSSRKPKGVLGETPILKTVIDDCRRRILEIELQRGETPTLVSSAALALRWAGGADVLLNILKVVGKGGFFRSFIGSNTSRKAVFSHLLRRTTPLESDSRGDFVKKVSDYGISEKLLVETAVFAPQWVNHIAAVLKWKGFADAVWWIHAHTKDTQWEVGGEIKEEWASEVSRRTPLTGRDLLDGAVDVSWFKAIRKEMKKEHWKAVYDAAKFASGGGGHKRAQLFAEAMLGEIDSKAVIKRIKDKRHQDTVRALGLIPLSRGAKKGKAELLSRYTVLQDFLRESKKFGSQRLASEKRAVEIGMQNLARNAGYADPLRLQWAMELEAIADLAKGSITVTEGEVEVTLAIDDLGLPQVSVLKKGKTLKSVPAKVKKVEKIARLLSRKTELKREASRTRLSLEEAMCRGDEFTAGELQDLFKHAVLAPMLERLVFCGRHGMGYSLDGAKALVDAAGEVIPLGKKDIVRIAHAHDFLESGNWHLWQRECFQRERIQPFKQVFRELYVLTAAEKEEKDRSSRYSGHQVHPKQALALLGKRGWVSSYEEGAHKTYHDENLTAWVDSLCGYGTPAEVEGITLESVTFTSRDGYKPVPLEKIPPRVFSEVMRDVDLVVSVAHRGGVDPEASASTKEIRAALVTETCELLKMKNVRVKNSHAFIDGQLGDYTVHLGSGVVHRQPGGMLCVVPVHAQHRGRLFLPFADDDPKTAEVLSKVLLFARDDKIKDPTIREQLS